MTDEDKAELFESNQAIKDIEEQVNWAKSEVKEAISEFRDVKVDMTEEQEMELEGLRDALEYDYFVDPVTGEEETYSPTEKHSKKDFVKIAEQALNLAEELSRKGEFEKNSAMDELRDMRTSIEKIDKNVRKLDRIFSQELQEKKLKSVVGNETI